MDDGLRETSLPGIAPFARGKVRDIYTLDGDQLLMITTDRISAFDAVLPTPIPDRGKVLNQLSAFWFQRTSHIVPNHVVTSDVNAYPAALHPFQDVLAGRSMLVRRTRRIDVECVARGYISGSAWSEYKQQGTACGIQLPAGLIESQQLSEPIFTPAIKAQTGHDENISFERLVSLVGARLAEQLRDHTLAIYAYAAAQAQARGIIIADTKMEFGLIPVTLPQPVQRHPGTDSVGPQTSATGPVAEHASSALDTEVGGEVLRNEQDGTHGRLILIDELLTPDSSRFWAAEAYRPGASPPSYDKQFVRDYLETTGWNKEPPAPVLPPDVVSRTRQKYIDALVRLTGGALR